MNKQKQEWKTEESKEGPRLRLYVNGIATDVVILEKFVKKKTLKKLPIAEQLAWDNMVNKFDNTLF